jgi:hypothetical protein
VSYQRICLGPRFCRLFGKIIIFYGEEFLAPCPTSKLEDYPLSVVRDCLFNVFAATLHNWRWFLHPQHEDAPCRGDSDQLDTVIEHILRKFWYVSVHEQVWCMDRCPFYGVPNLGMVTRYPCSCNKATSLRDAIKWVQCIWNNGGQFRNDLWVFLLCEIQGTVLVVGQAFEWMVLKVRVGSCNALPYRQ